MPFVDHLQGYIPVEAPGYFPCVTLEQLKVELTHEEYRTLKQHALCLACLAGNAFASVVEQYMIDAYNNLWWNDLLGNNTNQFIAIKNIYPMSARECLIKDIVEKATEMGIDPAEDIDLILKYYVSGEQEDAKD